VLVPPANSRYLAEHLPDVRYVELEGIDHPPWVGDNERFFAEVDRFLSSDHPAQSGPARLLQALLATDLALDTSLLGTTERFRGRPATTRSGVIYTFDGAIRAVDCALALMDLQPALRLSVHAGELEIRAGTISGPAVDVATTAVTGSPPGQVTVTSVVKDLALGSSLDLTAGPALELPSGGQLQLFFAARPTDNPGPARPAQNGLRNPGGQPYQPRSRTTLRAGPGRHPPSVDSLADRHIVLSAIRSGMAFRNRVICMRRDPQPEQSSAVPIRHRYGAWVCSLVLSLYLRGCVAFRRMAEMASTSSSCPAATLITRS
jgi:hypothetical protein